MGDTSRLDGFKDILRSKHLKATSQRMLIHAAMLELGHASADMVSRHIASQGGNISTASVYNTLDQLSGYGIYKRRPSADSVMYFDVNNARHIHLYDVFNQEFRDIEDDALLDMVEEIIKNRKFKGYKVDKVNIDIICHPYRRKTPLSF